MMDSKDININEVARYWQQVGDYARINGNGYRIFVDIMLYGKKTTQKDFLKRRKWNRTSVSKSLTRLYKVNLLSCSLDKDRNIVYEINEQFFDENCTVNRKVIIDIDLFCKAWDVLIEITSLSANCYRIILDFLLFGSTSQKGLRDIRGWKSAGISKTCRKLLELNLLKVHEKIGQEIIYTANIEYILSLYNEDEVTNEESDDITTLEEELELRDSEQYLSTGELEYLEEMEDYYSDEELSELYDRYDS